MPEDYETEPFELWPENEKSIALFSRLSTQWRTGFSGPVGLDYNPFFYLMSRMNLTTEEHDQLLYDIQQIESEALNIMHKKD